LVRLVAPLSLLALACSPGDRPIAHYDPSGSALFDAPWPTDDRHLGDGLDLAAFPDAHITLVGRYLEVAEALPGWGSSAPIYVPLSRLPAASDLPQPLRSVADDSPLVLIDIDPGSPRRGQRIPVQWELLPRGTFIPHPTLAVAPLFGFPLAPETRHALVITTDLVEPNPDFQDRLATDPALQDLRETLDLLRIPQRRVAVGTAFTPRDPLAELDVLIQEVRALPGPVLPQAGSELDSQGTFRLYEIALNAPLWMHGSKPFATRGGGFRYDAQGRPLVAEWERLRLAVSVPTDRPDPSAPLPVVLYGHGTGGSYRGFASSDGPFSVARVLAERGMVGIGFDQPLHGTRGTESTDVELHSFNYLNPESARAGFRQGALDIVWLLRALTDRPAAIALPGSGLVRLDPDQVSYVGHSHGGLTGGLALPWVAQDLRAAVLSGAGGGLAISVVKRKDPVDIAQLVGQVLQLDPGESLTPLHPVIGLVQLLVEETDPLAYAPAWFAEDRGYQRATTHVLLTSGRFDEQTDHETAEALAIAARMPQIAPTWSTPFGFGLRGLSPVPSPARDTVQGFDGVARTAGFSQWADGDHFVIFRDARARDMYGRFLATALQDRAEIAP